MDHNTQPSTKRNRVSDVVPTLGWLFALVGIFVHGKVGGAALIIGGGLMAIGGLLLMTNYRGIGTKEVERLDESQRELHSWIRFWPAPSEGGKSGFPFIFAGATLTLIGLGCVGGGLVRIAE